MVWVLISTVLMRWFFWAHKTYVKNIITIFSQTFYLSELMNMVEISMSKMKFS